MRIGNSKINVSKYQKGEIKHQYQSLTAHRTQTKRFSSTNDTKAEEKSQHPHPKYMQQL